MSRVQSSLVLNDQMSKVLGRINKAMGSVLDSFEAVQRASGKSFNTANIAQARKELGAADAALDEMEESYRKCNNQQDQLNKRIGQGFTAAGSLLGKIKGIASAYLGMKAVSGLVGLSDTITQTDARLNMMNDGLQTTAELNDMIYASAQRARGSYLATADAVAKLGLMAGDAFSSNQETIAFMEQVNKQFKIAGTSAAGIDAAMLQLTQAMGSGVLRGEEYNSILEQAPNIIQAIAKYMDVPKGQLKEMAADGKITADIVKAAMFACADETNAKFESMPKTWSDIWTSMQNHAIKALYPLLNKINELANSERVQKTVDGLINAFSFVLVILAQVFDSVCAVYNFVANNWSWIEPIVFGIAAALVAYNTALFINNTIQTISTGLKTLAAIAAVAHGTATVAEAAATTGMTAAQVAFNAALLSCPLTWIIVAIIAVIAVIYAVIAAINKATGSTISATGVIFGVICTIAAAIWNTILGLLNGILQLIWFFIEPFLGIIEFVLNAANGGFDSFGDAVKNLLGNIISWFLSLGKVVTAIIDAIFGTDWTGGLNSLQNTVLSWGKNDSAITISREAPTVESLSSGEAGRWSYKDAWNTGYSAGEWVDDKVSGFLDFGIGAESTGLDPYSGALGDIAKNTGDTAKNTGKSTEELSYLRDIAEREAINRFTTAEIKVDMSGMSNRIDGNMDIDGVISYFTDSVEEALVTAAEGVY